MDRDVFRCESIKDDQREQMQVFSIAEGCALYCTEEPFMGLFCAAAHFNHSCAPNATMESNRSTLLVRAASEIRAGEEVFLSYLPVELLERPGQDRRARLQGGRGFECRCQRCLDEAARGGDVAVAGG